MEEEKENPKLDNGLDIEDDSSSEESDDEVEISDLAATELDLPTLHGKLAPLMGGMELNLPDLEIGKGETAGTAPVVQEEEVASFESSVNIFRTEEFAFNLSKSFAKFYGVVENPPDVKLLDRLSVFDTLVLKPHRVDVAINDLRYKYQCMLASVDVVRPTPPDDRIHADRFGFGNVAAGAPKDTIALKSGILELPFALPNMQLSVTSGAEEKVITAAFKKRRREPPKFSPDIRVNLLNLFQLPTMNLESGETSARMTEAVDANEAKRLGKMGQRQFHAAASGHADANLYTNPEALITYCCGLLERGFDGVMLRGLDAALLLQQRKPQVLYDNISDVIHRVRKRFSHALFFIEDGQSVFEELVGFINGCMLHNVVMTREGESKLRFGSSWARQLKYNTRLMFEMQQRHDFIVFAQETVETRDAVQVELLTHFMNYCDEFNQVGHLSYDPYHMNPHALRFLKRGLGPLGLLDDVACRDFLKDYPLSKDQRPFHIAPPPNADNPDMPPIAVPAGFRLQQFKATDNVKNVIANLGDMMKRQILSQDPPVANTMNHVSFLRLMAEIFDRSDLFESQGLSDPGTHADLAELFFMLEYYERWKVGHVEEDYSSSDEDDLEEEEGLPTQGNQPDVHMLAAAERFLVNLRSMSNSAIRAGVYSTAMRLSGKITGQKEFGYRHQEAEFHQIVRLCADLRRAGLLHCMSDSAELEVYSGDPKENKLESSPDSRFMHAVKVLDELIAKPLSQYPIISAFNKQGDPLPRSAIVNTLRKMRYSLYFDDIEDIGQARVMMRVWEVDRQALKFVSTEGEKRYDTVGEMDAGVLHVYVRKDHPNLLEALLHTFMQTCGYSHAQCVMLEALGRQLRDPITGERRFEFMSDRIYNQIRNSSYEELCRFIQGTRKVYVQIIRRNELTRGQREVIQLLSKEILAACKERLLLESKEKDEKLACSLEILKPPHFDPTLPTTVLVLKRKLHKLFLAASWQEREYHMVKYLILAMNTMMSVSGTHGEAMDLVRNTMINSCRRSGLNLLENEIRDVSPYMIREPDLCTVMTEVGGRSDDDMRRLFGMSKHDIGELLYHRIRLSMLRENPHPILFAPADGSYDVSADQEMSLVTYVQKFMDGIFFMLPLLVNLIFVLSTNAGIYSSVYMNDDYRTVIGLAMLMSFIVTGGINSAIARIGSYTMFQWSFASMLVIVSRLVVGGFLVSCLLAFFGFAVGYSLFWDIAPAVVCAVYVVMFSLLQMGMGALFNAHMGSIWISTEGHLILVMVLCSVLVIYVFLLELDANALIVHFSVLFFSATFLLGSFVVMTHRKTRMFNHLRPRQSKEIMQWFSSVGGGPSPPPLDKGDKPLIAWYLSLEGTPVDPADVVVSGKLLQAAKRKGENVRRRAWKVYAHTIKKSRASGPLAAFAQKEVRARVMSYDAEEMLIHWYVLLTEQGRPDPWTEEWDVMLGESLARMRVKQRTDFVQRGAIFYDWVRLYVLMGILYFTLMFIDRIVRWTAGRQSEFFVPTSAYETAAGWAQVFFLTGNGALEPIGSRLQAVLKRNDSIRLKNNAIPVKELMSGRSQEIILIYITELVPFMIMLVLSIAFSLIMLLVFSPTISNQLWLVYVLGIMGYSGFLLGTFNQILFRTRIIHTCYHMIGSIALGYVAGVIAMYVGLFYQNANTLTEELLATNKGWANLSIVALSVGGWAYFTFTWLTFLRLRLKHVRTGVADNGPMMTTAMETSGQKWVGYANAVGDKDLAVMFSRVETHPEARFTSPDTATGVMVINLLNDAATRLEKAPKYNIMYTCFPDGVEQLRAIRNAWIEGDIFVTLVPEEELMLPSGQRLSASGQVRSGHRPGQKILIVLVGIQRDVPPDHVARQIAEALVHEFFETILGIPHSYAVIAEMLVIPIRGAVPMRIERQLKNTDNTGLMNLVRDTDIVVLQRTLLDIDPNLQWENLTFAGRQILCSMLELMNLDFFARPLSLKVLLQHTRLPAKQFKRGVLSLGEFCKAHYTVQQAIIFAQLSCQMAMAVKNTSRNLLEKRCVLYSERYEPLAEADIEAEPTEFGDIPLEDSLDAFLEKKKKRGVWNFISTFWINCIKQVDTWLRLSFLAVTGDYSFQRERLYASIAPFSKGGLLLHGVTALPLSLVNNIARFLVYLAVWTPVMLMRKQFVLLARRINGGMNRRLIFRKKVLYAVQRTNPEKMFTGFLEYGTMRDETDMNSTAKINSKTKRIANVRVFPGFVANAPGDDGAMMHRCEYDLATGVLERKIIYRGGKPFQTVLYDYGAQDASVRMPLGYDVYDGHWDGFIQPPRENLVSSVQYDERGRESEGIYYRYNKLEDVIEDEALDEINIATNKRLEIHAKFFHRGDVHDADTIADIVEFTGLPGHNEFQGRMTVFLHRRTTSIAKVEWQAHPEAMVLTSVYSYTHPDHPDISTYVETSYGIRNHENPLMILEDPFGLLGSLVNPTNFYDEDLTLPVPNKLGRKIFNALIRIPLAKFSNGTVGIYTQRYSTRQARTNIWQEWTGGKIEGVYARMWDQELLRREPLLKAYWFFRDYISVALAVKYLTKIETLVTPIISVQNTRSHLLMRVSDLLICGEGGDEHAHGNTEMERAEVISYSESLKFSPDNPLNVMGLDSGTWPMDGGGVASCRRDVIDRLPRVRWHQLSEIGNMMKLVQADYQIQKNVASLTYLPLFGPELFGPSQNVLSDIPYGELAHRLWITTTEVVERYFCPLVRQLVRASNCEQPSDLQLDSFTNTFTNMHVYFQHFDWTKTWENPAVITVWRAEWIARMELLQNSEKTDHNALLDAERPSLADIDSAMSIWIHMLLPLVVAIPDVPLVHASHHGIQSLIGAVAKKLRNRAFIIWDHGILWRERLLAISDIKSYSLFIRNTLLGLTRVSIMVNMHMADMVVSCCRTSNPEWEARLGSRRAHSDAVANIHRRLAPVINGMEVDKFQVHRELEYDHPCAVMLSHVYDLKDVKNAIRAAAVIINEYGLREYKLYIYGGLNKDLVYTDDCRAIIASSGLSNNVFLMGLGKAPKVLPTGWLFLNSSKSEGLPLALGEAGIAGLPVVCTDVGGSRDVVSEGATVFGRIVPARNAAALARGQVEVMAMLEELEALSAPFDEDGTSNGNGTPAPRKLKSRKGQEEEKPQAKRWSLEDFAPFNPDGPPLLERMMAMRIHRQRLGMRYRAFIKKNFHMDRYLREHEQHMWTGVARYKERMGRKIAEEHRERENAYLEEKSREKKRHQEFKRRHRQHNPMSAVFSPMSALSKQAREYQLATMQANQTGQKL